MAAYSTNNSYPHHEAAPPEEAWWDSLLEHEEEHQPQIPVDEEHYTSILAANALPNIDWDLIQTLFVRDDLVTLEVRSYNRGGLLVGTGAVQGFVPISHLIDLPALKNNHERKKCLPSYIGRKLTLKIIECDAEEARVIFSERAALAGEGSRTAIFTSIKPGHVISGTVTNITTFGVFVDLGGVEGLIHISELSWGRVHHPGDLVQIGQNIDARVLKISQADGRVALSHKQLIENPWDSLASRHQIGDIVEVVITNIQPFGIFARLEEGIEGLIHISTIDIPPDFRKLEDQYAVGKRISASILQINSARRRLGMKVID
jgi:small subunit ribosomal protein S1